MGLRIAQDCAIASSLIWTSELTSLIAAWLWIIAPSGYFLEYNRGSFLL